jgi:hypothetical protein
MRNDPDRGAYGSFPDDGALPSQKELGYCVAKIAPWRLPASGWGLTDRATNFWTTD